MGMIINPSLLSLNGGTSYSNSGGAGNRVGIIVATSNFVMGNTATRLIDGTYANDCWWDNTVGNGTACVTFDFNSVKVIDEFRWYQDIETNHGIWKFEGSNDNFTTFAQVGSDFTLGIGIFAVPNTISYRYYRLRHMSGTRSFAPYLREMEFKIS